MSNVKMQIQKQVEKLLNKTCLYGSHLVTVMDWDINEERGRFYLWTSNRGEDNPHDRPIDDAMALLNEFRPVDNPPAAVMQNTSMPGMMLAQGGLGVQLKEILLDNIEKVKADPNYIPQADAVKSSVDSILNIAKLEVEYLKTMNRSQKDMDY